MKKLSVIFFAALTLLSAVSCKKDNPKNAYGVDGVTPMPKAVDLGIQVDGKTVLWASFNLGASKEYEYGSFFAWGETEPKSTYRWANYQHAKGAENKLTRYCPASGQGYWDGDGTPDDETILRSDDDAAHVKLGGKWRMPTKPELDALYATVSDPDYSWDLETVKDPDGNDILGWRIVSNKGKTKGNNIFLPLTGIFSFNELFEYRGAGELTGFLSTHINPERPSHAYGLGITKIKDNIKPGSQSRADGLPIRPVRYK